jgi:hypothetical protein
MFWLWHSKSQCTLNEEEIRIFKQQVELGLVYHRVFKVKNMNTPKTSNKSTSKSNTLISGPTTVTLSTDSHTASKKEDVDIPEHDVKESSKNVDSKSTNTSSPGKGPNVDSKATSVVPSTPSPSKKNMARRSPVVEFVVKNKTHKTVLDTVKSYAGVRQIMPSNERENTYHAYFNYDHEQKARDLLLTIKSNRINGAVLPSRSEFNMMLIKPH